MVLVAVGLLRDALLALWKADDGNTCTSWPPFTDKPPPRVSAQLPLPSQKKKKTAPNTCEGRCKFLSSLFHHDFFFFFFSCQSLNIDSRCFHCRLHGSNSSSSSSRAPKSKSWIKGPWPADVRFLTAGQRQSYQQ